VAPAAIEIGQAFGSAEEAPSLTATAREGFVSTSTRTHSRIYQSV
jgi:hypothetical protein